VNHTSYYSALRRLRAILITTGPTLRVNNLRTSGTRKLEEVNYDANI
jgi:hypothetical protein